MSSIAVFPCPFTPAAGVIGKLAEILELELFSDSDLMGAATATAGADPEKLKKMLYGATSVFNQFTLEREMTVNLFRTLLADKLAGPGRYLFHGFLASLFPAAVTHVLRVLMVDNKQVRLARAMEQGLSERAAKRTVRAADVSAYSWTDFLFQKEAYDKSLYDLVIPVETRTEQELADEIIKAYRRTSVLHTSQSAKAVSDMQLAAGVERLMLQNGHKVGVQADGGTILLEVKKSVLNFGKLERELTELAKKVRGVVDVRVVKSTEYTVSIYRKQQFELPSKVLFVDDEKEFVQTVSDRLISRDVGTYGVYNGEDALELVSADRPDVMVLDLKMPGLNGVEVLRRTKELAPEVEVIILTGHGTSKDMLECMELGAFAYMNKPVDIEELSATIKDANAKVQSRMKKNNESKR